MMGFGQSFLLIHNLLWYDKLHFQAFKLFYCFTDTSVFSYLHACVPLRGVTMHYISESSVSRINGV